MGSRWIAFTSDRIDTQVVLKEVSVAGHGGESWFFGLVRTPNRGRDVRWIDYELLEPLARKVLSEICEEAEERWGRSMRVAVIHRQGRILPEEMSVAVGVSTPHRNEAFEACRYIIEELKRRAPIWKKEVYEDGETEWVRGHSLCAGSH